MFILKWLIFTLLVVLYYDPIMFYTRILKTKSRDEIENLINLSKEFCVESKLVRNLLIIVRLPIMLIFLMPLGIHITKIIKQESY